MDIIWIFVIPVLVLNITRFAAGEPMIQGGDVDVVVRLSETAVLPCEVQDLGTKTVFWGVVGRSDPITISRLLFTSDKRFSLPGRTNTDWSLQIERVTEEDEGDYRCSVSVYPLMMKKVSLIIARSPSLRLISEPEVDRVTLTCDVTSNIPVDITWWYIFENSSRSLQATERVLELHRDNDREGEYRCLADNGIPPAVYESISVTFPQQPSIRDQADEILYSIAGKSLHLTCVIDGNPLPTITWSINATILEDASPYITQTKQTPEGKQETYLMTKADVDISYLRGEFECKAINTYGFANKKFIVKPAALPYAPIINTVQPTSSSVDIYLAIKHQDNGPQPHTINVQLTSPDGHIVEMEVDIGENTSETHLVLNRLEELTTYHCEIRTVSVVGESLPAMLSITTLQEGVPVLDTTTVDLTVKTGEDITLACIIQNLGKNRVMWMSPERVVIFLDSARIKPDNRFSLSQTYDTDYSLTISNVKLEDRGSYQCVINTQPLTVKEFNLIVYVSPSLVPQMSSRNMAVRENDPVHLRCQFIGSPTPNITWYRSVKNDRNQGQEQLDVRGNVLTIQKISRYSDGEYKCIATNGVAPEAVHTIDVNVFYTPEIHTSMEKIGQYLGRDTVLECTAEGNPRPDIDWFIEDVETPLQDDWKYKITDYDDSDTVKTSSLTISNIDVSDYTNYTCQAANADGLQRKTMKIFAIGSPVILKEQSTHSITVIEGVEFDLLCVATGTPVPTVTWYKVNDDLENGIQIGPGATTFRNIKRTDEGHYKCIAENPIGEDSMDAYIKVEFPPSVAIDFDLLERRLGSDVTITCTITGNPEPNIFWRHTTNVNGTSEHILSTQKLSANTYQLTVDIKHIESKDFGKYECGATNSLNSSAAMFELFELKEPIITTTTTTTTATTTTKATTISTTTTEVTTKKNSGSHNLEARTTMTLTTELIEKASESPVVATDPGNNSTGIHRLGISAVTLVLATVLLMLVR